MLLLVGIHFADAQALWGAVSGVEVAERARVAAMAAKLRAELQQWMQDVQGAIAVHADFTPDDYHPPGYPAEGRNASGEAALQAERSSVRLYLRTACEQ